MSTYLLWVNDERTVLVRWWPDNSMEVCTRSEPAAIWGPPVKVEMEAHAASRPEPSASEASASVVVDLLRELWADGSVRAAVGQDCDLYECVEAALADIEVPAA